MKCECVNLHAFSGGREAGQGIGDWMVFYNHRRPHAAHGGETFVRVYRNRLSAYARTFTRQPWQRNERKVKPGRQAQTVA